MTASFITHDFDENRNRDNSKNLQWKKKYLYLLFFVQQQVLSHH